ncbi:hypothetical protein GF357_01685 [Candidatus Dojkabacteria bacterium]|nr:hypothetical protein [Candidatus Dojkabacteria bacterium]
MRILFRLPQFIPIPSTRSSKLARVLTSTIVIAFVAILAGSVAFQLYAQLRFQPDNVIISNHSSNSFSVVWTTDKPSPGIVKVNSVFNKANYDDRDVLLALYEQALEDDFWNQEVTVKNVSSYYTHHVTVRNLKSDTDYQVWIGNGIALKRIRVKNEFQNNYIEGSTVTTLPLNKTPDNPSNAYGYVLKSGTSDWDYVPEADGVVLMDILNDTGDPDGEFTRQNRILSSHSSADGAWLIDYSPWQNSSLVGDTSYQLLWAYGKQNLFMPEFINEFGDDAPMRPIVLTSRLGGDRLSRENSAVSSKFINRVYAYDCGQLLSGDCMANDHFYPEADDPLMQKGCSCTTPDGVNHWIGHGGTCYEISMECNSSGSGAGSGSDSGSDSDSGTDTGSDSGNTGRGDGLAQECNESNLGQECHQHYNEGELVCDKYGTCFRNTAKSGDPIECSWSDNSAGTSGCKKPAGASGPCILDGKENTSCGDNECATPCQPGYSCSGGNNNNSCCTGTCLRIQEAVVVGSDGEDSDPGTEEDEEDNDMGTDSDGMVCCAGPRQVEAGEKERLVYYSVFEGDECFLDDQVVSGLPKDPNNEDLNGPCGIYSGSYKVTCEDGITHGPVSPGDTPCTDDGDETTTQNSNDLVCCKVRLALTVPNSKQTHSLSILDKASCPSHYTYSVSEDLNPTDSNPCGDQLGKVIAECNNGEEKIFYLGGKPYPCGGAPEPEEVELEPVDPSGESESKTDGDQAGYPSVVPPGPTRVGAGSKCTEQNLGFSDGHADECRCEDSSKKRFVSLNEWCPEVASKCPNFFNSGNNIGKVCNTSGNTCVRDDSTATWLACTGPQPGTGSEIIVPARAKFSIFRISQVSAAENNTVVVKFDPKNHFYFFEEGGQYIFTIDGKEYSALVSGDSDKVILYLDENNNGKYDKDIDQRLSKEISDLKISKTASAYKYELRPGFNFVAFPFLIADEELRVASNLLDYINKKALSNSPQSKIYSISTYDAKWEIVASNSGNYDSNDFQIIPGRGYVIKSNTGGNFTIFGSEIIYETKLDSAPVNFNQGWNLIGVYGSKSKDYTAETLVDGINSFDENDFVADNVSYWASDKQRFSGLVKETNLNGPPEVYGTDFRIDSDKGYFVRIISGAGLWEPDFSDL